MKKIDIHTGKSIQNGESRYSNPINADIIKEHVFENIPFSISLQQWEIINECFGEYWNNKIGIGGNFYWDEISLYVYNNLKKANQLITQDRVEFIVELMLTKIEIDGGFLE